MNKRNWLITIMKESGVSDMEAARKMQIHRNTLYRVKNGEAVSYNIAQKIADFYGFNVEKFKEGADNEKL